MKKHLALVFAALCAFTAFAVTPCVPKGTVLALYVNCGPIARNADAQKLWKSLQDESHSFREIADGVEDFVKGFNSGADETLNHQAWKSARFDWAVFALGDYKAKLNDKGKFRVPPMTFTIGGHFRADEFCEAVLGSDLENGKVSKIDDLDFTAYRLLGTDLSEVANLKPCIAVPQDGVFITGSNTKILKKTVELYAGKAQSEPGLSKIFEKSPNGVFAVYADLSSLKKSEIRSALNALKVPERTVNDWFSIVENISQLKFFLSVVSEKDVHLAVEFVAKGDLAKGFAQIRNEASDEDFDRFMTDQIETALDDGQFADLKLKNLKFSHTDSHMRLEATINAIFLSKLFDAPDEDDEDDE